MKVFKVPIAMGIAAAMTFAAYNVQNVMDGKKTDKQPAVQKKIDDEKQTWWKRLSDALGGEQNRKH